MKIKMTLFVSCVLVFLSTNLSAGNPGKNAMSCVSASTNSKTYNNLIFKNRCSYKVFVVWCGDLKSSKKRCRGGSNYGFYTHSTNMKAYSSKKTSIKKGGSYSYAACKGGISFGSKGIKHPANKNGRFTCTRT